ncbi:hypothetical protein [Neolewinella antarctica]|uniref:O-antigen ligase n=1 Tax=Neolewinella antarctica TaxID=442734 RepID=A0ABX0X981_9BACT|nr:hypothetical protein [Neolewinella antarctica]NJC25543.1 O-antigen ligase [Neolewinella antarctica]
MKYVFIALVYFAVGFLFPVLSPTLTMILGVLFAVFTVGIIFTLYDDRLDDTPYGG